MLKSDSAVLEELKVGPATTDQIADGAGLARSTVQAAVIRLYRGFHIAKASLRVEWEHCHRDVPLYMLPEHAKAWGGRIADCREDAHSGSTCVDI